LRGFAKVTRDLTERKKMEEGLVQLAQTREALRLRDEFLSIASHELMTPITTLQLQLETVRERIDAIPASDFSIEALAPVLDGLLPMSRTWYLIQSEFALLALRSEKAREVFVEHHRTLEGEMEALIGDVVTRLGRTPVLPLDQLTDTVIGLYLHSLGQESLGTGALDTRVLVESVLPQVLLGLSVPR
jgi:signal transduction histidine kinase